jgi:hypothetical protein
MERRGGGDGREGEAEGDGREGRERERGGGRADERRAGGSLLLYSTRYAGYNGGEGTAQEARHKHLY